MEVNRESVLLFSALFFSKYSKVSGSLINFLNSNRLASQIPLKRVCIDNSQIRQRILKGKIKIEKVPCIISMYQDGRVDVFDGENINAWLRSKMQPLITIKQPSVEKNTSLSQELKHEPLVKREHPQQNTQKNKIQVPRMPRVPDEVEKNRENYEKFKSRNGETVFKNGVSSQAQVIPVPAGEGSRLSDL